MTQELKACPNPWCNSHLSTDLEIRSMERPIVVPNSISQEYSVSCPVCPINGPSTGTEADAIAAWNTRAPDSVIAELVEALRNSAAMLGAVYAWVDKVDASGGATSISGVSACHAMLKSLNSNRERAEKLVMEPTRNALAKLEASK